MTDVFPVPGANQVRSSWGAPRSEGRTHQGIDLFAPLSSPVVAPFKGHATSNQDGPTDRAGWWVAIEERGTGRRVLMTHLEARAEYTDGELVYEGETVGQVGTSGNAVGKPPHVHLEYQPSGGQDGQKVDPAPWLLAILRGGGATAATIDAERTAFEQQLSMSDRLIASLELLGEAVERYSGPIHDEFVSLAETLRGSQEAAIELAERGGYREGVELLGAEAARADREVATAMAEIAEQSWYRRLLGEEAWGEAVEAFRAVGQVVAAVGFGGVGLLLALAVGFLVLSRH